MSAAAIVRVPTEAETIPYTGAIIRSAREIAAQTGFVQTIAGVRDGRDPQFFLASISAHGWRPCVVVVSQGPRIAGLFYAKERVLAGVGTRVAFGDDAFNAMVVAAEEDREAVFLCAVEALLGHMFGLRLVVPSAWLPLFEKIGASADVEIRAARRHANLSLQPTYEAFLARLGPRTRRNLRYYRRRIERAGHRFVAELSFSEFAAVARRMFPNSAYAFSRPNLERCLAMIEAAPYPILLGLRTNEGEWMSLAGGWYQGDRAILLTQLNLRTYTRESVSLVMRSYLIEMLIGRGVRELIFWEGTSAPLCFYAEFPHVSRVYVDAPLLPWRVLRACCGVAAKLLPAQNGKLLKWIAPNGDGHGAPSASGHPLRSSESSDACN